MLFLQLASFLPHIAGRIAMLARRAPTPREAHARGPLQGVLVRLR